MKKASWIVMLLAALVTVGGCAPVLVGAGAGAGVYSWVEGELNRSYAIPLDKAVSVSKKVAKDLKIEITEKDDQGITVFLRGHQPDNTAVTIRLKTLAPEITEIGVRVGLVGIWDKETSQTIQNYIAKAI